MAAPSEEIDILLRLHAAPMAAPADAGWQDFLSALAAATRARGACLLVERGPHRHRADWGAAIPLPGADRLRGLRGERVYAQGEFDGWDAPLRVIGAARRGETRSWLAISHPFSDFRAPDGLLLARLAPHLGQAVETWLALGLERARAGQAAALAGDLGAGWLWFDAAGRVVELDDRARGLLDSLAGVRLPAAARLELADPLQARALRRALDLAVSGQNAAPVVLGWGDPAQLAVLAGLAPPAPGADPVLRAVIRRAPLAAGIDLAALATHLGLSRSETRLAALLCDGLTLAEAAARLGWTLETARSASKRIFAQTGARGQTDLVRRMQTGTGWFHRL